MTLLCSVCGKRVGMLGSNLHNVTTSLGMSIDTIDSCHNQLLLEMTQFLDIFSGLR